MEITYLLDFSGKFLENINGSEGLLSMIPQSHQKATEEEEKDKKKTLI